MVALLAVAGIGYAAFAAGVNHNAKQEQSKQSTSATKESQSKKASTSSSTTKAGPAFGGQGTVRPEVTQSTIDDAETQLKNAGFPVDQWAPSDIEKIVSDANQQGVSVVDFAQQNFHK